MKNTRKDNSERRRKLTDFDFNIIGFSVIREKITPRGDGNYFTSLTLKTQKVNTRKDNSERRRKRKECFYSGINSKYEKR